MPSDDSGRDAERASAAVAKLFRKARICNAGWCCGGSSAVAGPRVGHRGGPQREVRQTQGLVRVTVGAARLPSIGRAATLAAKKAMNEKTDITLTINGRDYPIRVEPRKTLVDAIRDDCGQTGTHIGCEHGVCGTCTVIVDDEAVRSCLMFAVQAAGKKIRTVEGLADGDKLNVLQQAFIDNHGLQCGYCTPGFLMLATNVLEKYPQIGDEDLTDMLASNLCRCTGYQNIIKAVRAARDQMRGAKVTVA